MLISLQWLLSSRGHPAVMDAARIILLFILWFVAMGKSRNSFVSLSNSSPVLFICLFVS
jgi:hypothetical protein